jgi:hypothetical protein
MLELGNIASTGTRRLRPTEPVTSTWVGTIVGAMEPFRRISASCRILRIMPTLGNPNPTAPNRIAEMRARIGETRASVEA